MEIYLTHNRHHFTIVIPATQQAIMASRQEVERFISAEPHPEDWTGGEWRIERGSAFLPENFGETAAVRNGPVITVIEPTLWEDILTATGIQEYT